mmetsp:Transcript_28438/g.64483  ORF Transcript_28438/g.64483 Transcript_28438/m.64483 type:complete len:115 (-) Transcript_28438:328-672(-)
MTWHSNASPLPPAWSLLTWMTLSLLLAPWTSKCQDLDQGRPASISFAWKDASGTNPCEHHTLLQLLKPVSVKRKVTGHMTEHVQFFANNARIHDTRCLLTISQKTYFEVETSKL